MAKKRIRALNADGDVTWCSAEVMGTKGCNHLAHGTETEMEAAQIEFFMNEGGLIGNAISENDSNIAIVEESKDNVLPADITKILEQKEKLEGLLAKRGLTEEHLEFLVDPANGNVLMDADFDRWMQADEGFSSDDALSEDAKKLLLTKLAVGKNWHSDPKRYIRIGVLAATDNVAVIEEFYKLHNSRSHLRSYLSYQILHAIQRNPNTPASIIHQMSEESSAYDKNTGLLEGQIAERFSTNPNTPPEVMTLCAQELRDVDEDKYYEIIRAFNTIQHPNLPEKDLDEILSGKYGAFTKTKRKLARDRNTSPEILEKLYNSDKEEMMPIIAENPNTPPELLASMFTGQDPMLPFEPSWNVKMVRNPNMPTRILDEVALYPAHRNEYDKDGKYSKNYKDFMRAQVAGNPNASPKALAELAKDRDLRIKVAANPSAPKELIEAFSKENDYDVRRAVAQNPSASTEALERVAASPSRAIALSILDNPSASPEALRRVIPEMNATNFDLLATHPNATPAMLNDLIQNGKDIAYSTYPKSKKSMEKAYMDMLAKMASNPHVPVSALQKLAKVPDRTDAAPIRRALLENSNFPMADTIDLSKKKNLQEQALTNAYLRLLK